MESSWIITFSRRSSKVMGVSLAFTPSMTARCFCIGALEDGPEIMRGLCLRHQGGYLVGESGEKSTIDESVLSALCLVSRIWDRHWRRVCGGDRFRRCGKRSIRIFEEIINIKESFNLEFG